MIKKIDHIGIAVRDPKPVLEVYKALGLEPESVEEVTSQKVRVTFLNVGESRLELLEPTSDDSPIAKALETRGEGVHHIAFAVDDIEEAIKKCQEAGMRMIDQVPRIGAHHNMIAFIHPKSTHGVLVEVCAKQKE